MLIITVEDSAFRAKLEKLQASMGNLTPVMSEIGDRLEEKVRQRFETRTDPNGVPWKPWAESTDRGYPWPNAKTKERLKYGPGNDRFDVVGGRPFEPLVGRFLTHNCAEMLHPVRLS
jgi:phage gpG-like protein